MLGGFKRLMASALLAFFTGGVALGLFMAPTMTVGPELPVVESIFAYAAETTVQIQREGRSIGSGVVIDTELMDVEEGAEEDAPAKYMAYILTADHVVSAMTSADCLVGRWEDGALSVYSAMILDRGLSDIVDLAIIRVDNLTDRWTASEIIDPVRASELAPGQEVWLAGYPTKGLPQVSHGHIQNMGGDGWDDFMRMSASIVYGNSGGPVFLPDGRLVGIGVRLHISAGLPVWTISRAVTPENIHDFLMSTGFGYLVNGTKR